ncbi:Mitogen-activated protein kinase kinase kinase, partial [Tetrabaena socialis]
METSLDRVLHGRPGQKAVALMPLDKVLHIAMEIARGLAYLHPFIVHRDCKPANVLLNDPWGPRPVVKITDFGLSRLRSTVQATRTPGAGTPAYLAPEGYDAAPKVITHQADIFSFGVVLWEMLSGSQPWKHCDMMTLAYDVTVRRQRLPLEALEAGGRCPPKLRLLLRQCWEQDPRRRPAAAELVKELAGVLQVGVEPLEALEAGGRCPPKLLLLLQQCWEQDPRRRPAAAELVKELAGVLQ